ncbi:MAG: hypothetical protein JRN21_07665 [Nitrososphaerota archaeon]|nr:hypothetical protein [Nitrososphaerota archaeon]
MTSSIKKVAGGTTILESAFAIYTMWTWNALEGCPSGGCVAPQLGWAVPDLFVVLAFALLAVGALGFWGASVAYPAGAGLSAVFLALLGYLVYLYAGYPSLGGAFYQYTFGAVLAALGVGLNLLGLKDRSTISEQANPMNLPVFG